MSIATVETKEKNIQSILNDNLWNVMFKLSWPAIIAMVCFGLNALLNLVFVEMFVGETALAGVVLAYPITQLGGAFGCLIGVGTGSVLSIVLGSKDKDKQKRLLGNMNVLTIICSILYVTLALTFSKQLIAMMGGSGEALVLGNEYFRTTVLGAPFLIYGLAANMIIRAEGKMRTAAWMMALGLIVNAISSYTFIVLLDMGVSGAAWGTNVGMLVYFIVGLVYFGRGHATFISSMFSFKADINTITDILRLGTPSFIMMVMTLLQSIVVFNALSRFGTVADIAFYGVVFQVYQLFLTPVFGLMRALQPMIGINYGARQYERVINAYKIFGFAAMSLTIPFWFISLMWPDFILGLLLTGQVVTNTELWYFRIYMLTLPFMSFLFMAMTLFPSINKGKPAAMIGMVRQFIFYIPVMLILPRFIGVAGVYYGAFAIDAVIVLWTLFMVKREFISLRKRTVEAL